jgi:hypothetical protein
VSELRQVEVVLQGDMELLRARGGVIYWRKGGSAPLLNLLPCHISVASKA